MDIAHMRTVRVLILTLFAFGLVLGSAGQAVAAGPPYRADLSLSSGTAHGRVGDLIEEPYYVDNLGPSNTRTGDVTFDFVAPGGTVFVIDPNRYRYCHVITAGTHYWCYEPVQIWVSQGTIGTFVRLKIVSATVTPGRITVSCTCDPNGSNNATTLHVVVDGVPSSPPSTPSPHRSSATQSPRPHDSPTVHHYIPAPVRAPPAVSPAARYSGPVTPTPTASTDTDMMNSADASDPGVGLPIYLGAMVAVLFIAGAIAVVYRRRMSGPRS